MILTFFIIYLCFRWVSSNGIDEGNLYIILDKLKSLEIKIDLILQSKNDNMCIANGNSNCCTAKGFKYDTSTSRIYYPSCSICCQINDESYCRDATYNKRSECECKKNKKKYIIF